MCLESKKILLEKNALNSEEENLWNSHWCTICACHNYPLEDMLFLKSLSINLPTGLFDIRDANYIMGVVCIAQEIQPDRFDEILVND